MNIPGRVFLVSGGCSGLGAATVSMLASAGAKIVVADIAKNSGTKTLGMSNSDVVFVQADVTSEIDIQDAVNAAMSNFGSLNGAICCAGIAPGERILGKAGTHSLATFTRAIQVNLIGTFNVIRLAAEAICKIQEGEDGERGVIICTSSIAAYEGQIGQAAYAASKGGVASMTLPIARELARFGIRVATIAPGVFDTAMLAGMPESVRESLRNQVPFPRRLGKPQEYATLVRHIIENPMLNGVVIRLDGAMRMASK